VCRYDIGLLRRDGEEMEDFKWECKNKFVALEALREEERNADIWGDVKKVLKESADCTLRS